MGGSHGELGAEGVQEVAEPAPGRAAGGSSERVEGWRNRGN